MPAYDATRFEPPAPLAHVTLRHPETGMSRSDVPMLLDSGADVTIVPQAAVSLLGVSVIRVRVQGKSITPCPTLHSSLRP